MKKLILAVAVITLAAATVNAQDKNKDKDMKKGTTFGIAANVGAPASSGYKIAFGGDAQVDIGLSEYIVVTVSAGYENVSYKAGTGYAEGHTNFIPVLAGLKYYISEYFYGHGQLGYSFSTAKNGGGSFTFAPSLGYNFGKNFDVSLKYLGIGKINSKLPYGSNSLSLIALRLAYNFGK